MYVSPLLREKQNGSIKVIRFTFKNLTYPRRSLWCGMSFDRSRDTHSKIKTPIKRMLPFKKKRACTLGPKIWHLRDCNGSCSLRGCMGELILYPVLLGIGIARCCKTRFVKFARQQASYVGTDKKFDPDSKQKSSALGGSGSASNISKQGTQQNDP